MAEVGGFSAHVRPGDDGWYDGPYGTSVADLYGAECPSDGVSVYPDDCPTYMNAFCESGDERTIFVQEGTENRGEYVVSVMKLNGTDANNPSDDDFSNMLLGDVPEITIQRTVSTGVYSEVSSYE